MVYPPAGSVITQIEVQRERRFVSYSARSLPLVYPGQEVLADQPVIRLELRRAEGQSQPQMPVPVVIRSGLRGQVIRTTARGGVVIQTRAALLTGSIGAGQQVAGILTLWQPAQSRPIPAGAILVVPGAANIAMLRQAVTSGVVGIVAGSIEMRDFESFLGLDIFNLLNSIDVDMAQARLPSLTLFLAVGFGAQSIPQSTLLLLTRYLGSIALLSGVTSTRYALYPELVISLPAETQRNWQPPSFDTSLRLGTRVQVRLGTNMGAIGDIDYFFVHQQRFLSGVQGRAVRLRLADGSTLVAPVMNIERIP